MRWKKSRSTPDDTGDLFCVFLPFLAKRTRTHLLVRFSIIRAFQQAFGKRVSYAAFAPVSVLRTARVTSAPALASASGLKADARRDSGDDGTDTGEVETSHDVLSGACGVEAGCDE